MADDPQAPFAHLTQAVRDQAAALGKPERIALARTPTWINHDEAAELIRRIGDVMAQPRTSRMEGLLVVGDSNNGKTSALERFRDMHPPCIGADGHARVPVLLMDMPSTPEETRFLSELLVSLRVIHRDNDPPDRKMRQAEGRLALIDTRLLIIDDIHNMLAGGPRDQRRFLVVLKRMSSKLGLPVVVAGTREALAAMHTDPQVSDRFEAQPLRRWSLDRSFLRLLASFEQVVPLAHPSLMSSDPKLAQRIFAMSDGTIGSVARILAQAAVQAIESGSERIGSTELDGVKRVPLRDYRDAPK